MTHRKLLLRATLGAALLVCGSLASAALVTNRAALGGDDFIDWGQLGAAATFNPLAEPAGVTSNLGRSATVQNTGGDLYRFDEGDGTFGGHFTTGDALLFTFLMAATSTSTLPRPPVARARRSRAVRVRPSARRSQPSPWAVRCSSPGISTAWRPTPDIRRRVEHLCRHLARQQ